MSAWPEQREEGREGTLCLGDALPWPRPGSPEGDAGDTLQGAAAVAVGQPERTVDGRGTPPRPTSRSSPKSSDKSKSFSIDSILARRQGQKPAGGGELLGVAKQGPGGCLGASLLATSSTPPDRDLESPSSRRLEALVPSRDSRAMTRSP